MYKHEDKLADLLCKYSLKIKKGDIIMIRGDVCAEPLIRSCFRAILECGGHPVVRMSFTEQNALLFKHASDEQLSNITAFEKLQAETISGYIAIDSTSNSSQLTTTDPSKIAIFQKTNGTLREIMFAREAKGDFAWVIAPYPTQAMAQNAEMPYDEYRDFVFNACKLNEADPVKAWQQVGEFQEKVVNILTGKSIINIKGDRTDLTLNISGRSWRSCCGLRNMPDGEVFTSPVEDSAEGCIYFDIPTNYNGVEAGGVYLEFKKGKVVKAEAAKGEAYLLKMLDTDEGARFVGEIAFGLNNNITKPSKSILFDEKIGRTMHLAVGASYAEAGGKNKSALHWDLVKSMYTNSSVSLDGKLIYKDGKFLELEG